MVPINKVKNGIVKYLDAEVINKLPGWRSWVFGAGAIIMLSKVDTVIDQVKEHPVVKMMGVIDGDMVDVETIYAAFKKQTQTVGAVDISIPTIGNLRMGTADIDRLYNFIMEG